MSYRYYEVRTKEGEFVNRFGGRNWHKVDAIQAVEKVAAMPPAKAEYRSDKLIAIEITRDEYLGKSK